MSVGRYLRPYYKAWILNEHMKNFSVKVFSVKSRSAVNIGSEIVKMLSQQKAFIYFDSNFVFFLVRWSVYIVYPWVLSGSNLKLHQTLEAKNNFEQGKITRQLTFNPGLTLTGFRTTRPSSLYNCLVTYCHKTGSHKVAVAFWFALQFLDTLSTL